MNYRLLLKTIGIGLMVVAAFLIVPIVISLVMKTGEVYKIYIKSNGYQDEYFSLLIDWYQDELYINARMKKLDKTDGAEK